MKILGRGLGNPSLAEFDFFEFPNDEHIIGTTVDDEMLLSLDGNGENPELADGLEGLKLDDDTSTILNATAAHGDTNDKSGDTDLGTPEPEGRIPSAQLDHAADSAAAPAWQALNGWEAVGSEVLPGLPVVDGRDGNRGPPDTHTDSPLSDGPSTTIVPIASTFAAKGGTPGGPGNNDGDGGSGDEGDTGGDGVLNEYFSGSANDLGYDIWLDFKGSGWTVELQSAFTAAADYLTTVITDDIGGGGRYRGKTIDDIYVTAELATIDGAGGVLGQAGPTAVWTANDLTAAGQMEFDVADATDYLSSGLWDDIVTHEFFHVLGFGSLWNYGDHALVENNQYIGQQALDAYGDAFIPVEDGGGAGTIGAHWDEQALDNELMTGYINDDGDASTNDDNYLSEFSVMSLADLGYAVAYQDYPYDDGFLSG